MAQIELELVDCADRRITRVAVEAAARDLADGQTEVSVLLPERKYPGVWHRILHDQTADAIVRAVSRMPHANVTTVPFHFDSHGRGKQAAEAVVPLSRRGARRRRPRTNGPAGPAAAHAPDRTGSRPSPTCNSVSPCAWKAGSRPCGSDRSRGPRRSNASSPTLRACCRSCSWAGRASRASGSGLACASPGRPRITTAGSPSSTPSTT